MKKIISTLTLLLICSCGAFAQETVFHQEVTWSPDGKYISFSVYRKADPSGKQFKHEIYVMNADGSKVQKVADEASWTSWSKDGKYILFSRSNTDKKTSDIFKVKKDGSGLIQLTKDAKQNSHPAFSPDGKKIAFISNRDNSDNEHFQIYIMNPDGSNLRQITTDYSVNYNNPSWSPDSKRIVYFAEKGDAKDQIWTIGSDGTNQTLLTNNVGHNIYPAFYPDGKNIIFASKRDDEKTTIYQVNINGTNLQKVANLISFYARYSPNGKKVAFIVGGFPKNDIFIADADGTNQIKITNKELK